MDTWRFNGSYTTGPSSGSPSGEPRIETPFDESLTLADKSIIPFDLISDSPSAVPFALSGANLIVIKCVGGKIRVRLTSADGTSQSFPVNSLLVLVCEDNPVTAIDLTREAGIEVTGTVFLGQQA